MSHIHFNTYSIAESIPFLLKLTCFGGAGQNQDRQASTVLLITL